MMSEIVLCVDDDEIRAVEIEEFDACICALQGELYLYG